MVAKLRMKSNSGIQYAAYRSAQGFRTLGWTKLRAERCLTPPQAGPALVLIDCESHFSVYQWSKWGAE